MSELKRCPFCGDDVDIVPTGLYHWKYAIRHKSKTECILDANAFALPYEKEDAVRMWNTRADHKTENSSEKPNNCEECEHWNDTEDGCADRHGCKTEPQTLDDIGRQIQDAYDKGILSDAGAVQAWYEAVSKFDKDINVRSKTEPQTSGVVWIEDAIKDEPKSYSTWASTDEPQTERPPMDEYYKDHDEFYDCDRYVITNDEGERAYNCIGCQTDCPWK